MAHVLESTRSFLYANPEQELPDPRSEAFKKLVKQRAQGQPIAYLTESSEFWSLPLKVNPSVLIPRPDTERLVEAALSKVVAPGPGACLVLDGFHHSSVAALNYRLFHS